MATKKKAPEKAGNAVKSVLPQVGGPENAVLNLGNGFILSLCLDMNNGNLTGSLVVPFDDAPMTWTATFDE